MSIRKASTLNEIYALELEVCKQDVVDARRNARLNFKRVEKVRDVILEYLPGVSLKVLNLSGLNAGQMDVGLSCELRKAGIEILCWDAIDTKQNVYLENLYLKDKLSSAGVSLQLHDFSDGLPALGQDKYDVILLTDVIEHLDYTDVLKLLEFAREHLEKDAIAIISVPNPHYLIDRFRFLLGAEPWIDLNTRRHIKQRFYGHINIYSGQRIVALADAVELQLLSLSSFNHFRYSITDNPLKFILGLFIDIAGSMFHLGKFTMLAVCKKQSS